MVSTIIIGTVVSLLLVCATSTSKQSEEGIEVRPRYSPTLLAKLRARANSLGLGDAEASRYYTCLGMQAEDFFLGKSPDVGNIDTIRPAKSRRQKQVFMIDSDLIPHLKNNPYGEASVATYINHCIRKDIIARKNNHDNR
jgi:hypothetical protein